MSFYFSFTVSFIFIVFPSLSSFPCVLCYSSSFFVVSILISLPLCFLHGVLHWTFPYGFCSLYLLFFLFLSTLCPSLLPSFHFYHVLCHIFSYFSFLLPLLYSVLYLCSLRPTTLLSFLSFLSLLPPILHLQDDRLKVCPLNEENFLQWDMCKLCRGYL